MAEALINPEPKVEYLEALARAKNTGSAFVQSLPGKPERRQVALKGLPEEFEVLDAKRQQLLAQRFAAGTDELEKNFLEAAGEMRTGNILIVSAEAAESSGDVPDEHVRKVTEALYSLAVDERLMNGEAIRSLNFKASLTETIKPSATAAEALQIFKDRAAETLDNMVSDAYDLLAGVIGKLGKEFNAFAKDLGELAKSFTSGLADGVMKLGLEKIISGMKSLAEILQNDSLSEAIDAVRDAIDGGLKGALAKVYKCDSTKETIEELTLADRMTSESLDAASNSMAEISTRYVGLLKLAKRILSAIGASGALLGLSAAFAPHVAALGVPAVTVAYAVLFVATVLIGMDFARSKMNILIAAI